MPDPSTPYRLATPETAYMWPAHRAAVFYPLKYPTPYGPEGSQGTTSPLPIHDGIRITGITRIIPNLHKQEFIVILIYKSSLAGTNTLASQQVDW
jgi:hypothetical protein